MNGVRFTVPGDPIGKQRPRVVKDGDGRSHAYTPKKTKSYEALIASMYEMQSNGRKWMNGEKIEMWICVYYRIPESYGKRRRSDIAAGIEAPTKKPDGDNILKAFQDALQGVAFTDDKQIIDSRVVKDYSDGDPYVFVSISEIDQDEYQRRRAAWKEEQKEE